MKQVPPLFANRDASRVPGAACVLLLAISAGFPESQFVTFLQGRTLAAELHSAQVVGYYEQLLDATEPGKHLGAGLGKASSSDNPPPGWLNFAAADVLERDPSFLRFRLRSNVRRCWNGNMFSTNSLGYRTPEVKTPKPKGTYRIVVIGSSNTMGQGVGDADVYVRKLESWLNNSTCRSGKKVEVVNLAVSSDAPSQQTYRLAVDAARLEPDWILNDATFFDLSLEAKHLRDILARRVQIPFPRLISALSMAKARVDDPPAVFDSKLMDSIEPILAAIYADFAAEAKKLGAPMTIILLPRADLAQSNPNLKRLFKILSYQNDLQFFDLSESFKGLDPQQFRAAPWEKHPSKLGHQKIFEALEEAIEHLGGLPGL